MIRGFLLFLVLFLQFVLGILFKGDIPMNVNMEDFFYIGLFSIISFLIVFIKNKSLTYGIVIISLIFSILWLISLINLILYPCDKSYVIDILGLLGTISCTIFSFYKIKTRE